MRLDRKAYNEEVGLRWHGPALLDARGNWHLFKENQARLIEFLREYLRNPGFVDLAGKWHNSSGGLTGALWLFSNSEPWVWDFEERYQRCFLRRGLIAYCKQILRVLESPPPEANGQLVMSLEMA